jgi:ketosteroid isomerase-like protein
MNNASIEELAVREVLQSWAEATRENRMNDVLKNHSPNLVIFDVLPPMKYESAQSYRHSWDDWQPQTEGQAQFDLEHLVVAVGSNVAFAHCFIRCGGVLQNGQRFSDVVRATFGLEKTTEHWMVCHQHVSKPYQLSKS